ncbi:threonine-phosphate decarboxylase [Hasllibacter sp. MH4015]|uniref:threonine-phosphate decarboxylase n=1 Tax=Hasllibacter sp. MH4015 TaxID=2854029 RepID=UPI001CD2BE5E|nr:threonine-phosphate decarboxylase [Hasllibacter sp. MH4015]
MTGPGNTRDHGGGLDAAMARYGGSRDQWLDLSTGINPVPYPIGDIPPDAWHRLPDEGAMDALLQAARRFWNVPDSAQIIAAPGASALIARMPLLTGSTTGGVHIPRPTYNEHAAAFEATGDHWLSDDPNDAFTHVYVHPNNPDGRLWSADHMGGRTLTVIDESFCDTDPGESHIALAPDKGIVVLKSFGKFWGLAGLRLGFLIGTPETLAPVDRAKRYGILGAEHEMRLQSMADALGPWPVSGPALEIGTRALGDTAWAEATRARLAQDAARLDDLILRTRAELVGGTGLFRTYAVPDAAALHDRLARARILTRIFPYSERWMRFGLPGTEAHWAQLEAAL